MLKLARNIFTLDVALQILVAGGKMAAATSGSLLPDAPVTSLGLGNAHSLSLIKDCVNQDYHAWTLAVIVATLVCTSRQD